MPVFPNNPCPNQQVGRAFAGCIARGLQETRHAVRRNSAALRKIVLHRQRCRPSDVRTHLRQEVSGCRARWLHKHSQSKARLGYGPTPICHACARSFRKNLAIARRLQPHLARSAALTGPYQRGRLARTQLAQREYRDSSHTCRPPPDIRDGLSGQSEICASC